ncbi:MAG: hypothetical protein ABGY95_07695 [Rubritalea sp.]|uniref:hypothetical protein n=1 Tax=Rubritalea sp. TaxID=2109375 RepID=UPI00324244C8
MSCDTSKNDGASLKQAKPIHESNSTLYLVHRFYYYGTPDIPNQRAILTHSNVTCWATGSYLISLTIEFLIMNTNIRDEKY